MKPPSGSKRIVTEAGTIIAGYVVVYTAVLLVTAPLLGVAVGLFWRAFRWAS
jgi:hypothetical protein